MKPSPTLVPGLYVSFLFLLLISVLLLISGSVGCATAPPDPALAFLREGDAALAVGESEKAVAAFQLALAVDPDNSRAVRGLLLAQVENGEAEDALATLAQIEARVAVEAATRPDEPPDPVDPCPALALGVSSRLERAQEDGAEALARRALADGCPGGRSQLAAVVSARARTRALAGDVRAAIAGYRESIELDPDEPGWYRAAAELLIAGGRTRDAVALLADGLERHPDDRSLRDLMVRALTIR